MGASNAAASCISRHDKDICEVYQKQLLREVRATLNDPEGLRRGAYEVFLSQADASDGLLSLVCSKELVLNLVCRLDCNNVTVVKEVHRKFDNRLAMLLLQNIYWRCSLCWSERLLQEFRGCTSFAHSEYVRCALSGMNKEEFADITEEAMILVECNLSQRFETPESRRKIGATLRGAAKNYLFVNGQTTYDDCPGANFDYSKSSVCPSPEVLRRNEIRKQREQNDKSAWREIEGALVRHSLFQQRMTLAQARTRCTELKDLCMFTCESRERDEGSYCSIAFGIAIDPLVATTESRTFSCMEAMEAFRRMKLEPELNKLSACIGHSSLELEWKILNGSIKEPILVEQLTVQQAKLRLLELRGVKGFFCEDTADEVKNITFFCDGDVEANRSNSSKCTVHLMPEEEHQRSHVVVPPIRGTLSRTSVPYDDIEESDAEIIPDDSASRR